MCDGEEGGLSQVQMNSFSWGKKWKDTKKEEFNHQQQICTLSKIIHTDLIWFLPS